MFCLSPINIREPSRQVYDSLAQRYVNATRQVPCGKCFACKNRRRQDWGLRLNLERRKADRALFCMLSYNDEHLPVNPDTGLAHVEKRHIQNYMKYLRKFFDPLDVKLKFFAVSELGPDTGRPHYHLLLFLFGDTSRYPVETLRKELFKLWNKCDDTEMTFNVQEADEGSCYYVAKYCLKGDGVTNDESYPMFSLMSKGLGFFQGEDITENMRNWINADPLNRMYYPVGKSKRHLPRYLKEKMVDEDIRKQFCEQVDKMQYEMENDPHYAAIHKQQVDIQRLQAARLVREYNHNKKIR